MFNAEADTFRMSLFHEVTQTKVKAFRLKHSNAFAMREVIDEVGDRWLLGHSTSCLRSMRQVEL